MPIQYKLESFEGPLDLLLHLIDKNKVSIYDIPIAEITAQYLEYLHEMEQRDLEVMSDFLVMAATLLRIKSQMLLPLEVSEDGEEIDPREELVNRLLEYKMYKYISYELKDKQLDAARVVFKKSTLPPEIADFQEEVDVSELLSELSLSKLHSVFQSLLRRKADSIDPVRSKFGTIEKEEISVNEKIMELQDYGLVHRKFNFRKFIGKQKTRTDIVVSFLGILELIHMGRIEIRQDELFDDIEINYIANDVISIETLEALEGEEHDGN